MTTVTVPLKQLPSVLAKLEVNFSKGVKNISKNYVQRTATHVYTLARKIAPVDTGHLRGNIRLVWNAGKPSVTSTVDTPWKYNFWVDNRPGWTSWGRRYYTVSRSGYAGNDKGGFFTFAVNDGRKYGKETCVRMIRKLKLV